ncbi:ATP-dependent helicase hrpA [Kaumoebavirus]|uniref:ATP-dependent helicase hrpA n=1 Tax=Kaumoebavirus TaxID=1859492 RepID=UPI0009C1D7CA|nr:ATP-dependent helicase hrpA [Kaumoebavirus]ARA71975.1 ATP-dependent helicase hrpA [Kaumoebavirus]
MSKAPKPTLLQRGKIVPMPWDPKDLNEQYLPIEWVMKVFKDRAVLNPGDNPVITTTKPSDRMWFIRAKTASGKSTIIPPRLFQFFNRTVACTQPRVTTAKEIPRQVADHNPDLIIGKNLGYQTGSFTKKGSRGVIYMTVGVLQQQLLSMDPDAFCKKYGFIVVDEAHERSAELDLLLFLLKQFFALHYMKSNCPFLIVMSATFDVNAYAKYFDAPQNIIEIEGATAPIEEHFSPFDVTDCVSATLKVVNKILTTGKTDFAEGIFRDIIIFTQGEPFMTKIIEALEREFGQKAREAQPMYKKGKRFERDDDKAQKRGGGNKEVELIKLTSESYQEQGEDFEKMMADYSKIKRRRIFVATNAAETGLTIDTLKYVVDTGFYKTNEYYPNFDVYGLITKPVTRGMALQRRGRVGRKAPGVWYPLYTKETFESLQEDQYPKLLIEEISSIILTMIATGKKDFKNIDLMDSPSPIAIQKAIEKLFYLGLVDKNGDITELGEFANKIRKLSLEDRVAILSGYAWNASVIDLITAVSMIRTKKGKHVYYPVTDDSEETVQYLDDRFNLVVADDILNGVLLFNSFCDALMVDPLNILEWCDNHKVKYKEMLDVSEIRDEIIEGLANLGLNPFANSGESLIDNVRTDAELIERVKNLKHCLWEGYKLNVIERSEDGKYYKNGIPLKIKGKLKEFEPQRILVPNVNLKPKDDSPIYVAEVDKISILDGFL